MEKKSCLYCIQEIPKIATKCCYYSEWQPTSKWDSRNPKNRKLYVTIGLILAISLIVFDDSDQEIGSKKEAKKFVKGKTPITILSQKITRNGKRLFVVGEVKNEDKINWEHIKLSAKYYNKNDQLIDTSVDYLDLKVGESQTYKVEFHYFDKSDPSLYDKYKLEVTSASHYGR